MGKATNEVRSKKRTLNDYFSNIPSPSKKKRQDVSNTDGLTPSSLTVPSSFLAAQDNPAPTTATKIPGLQILSEFITTHEEGSLLSYLEAQKWRADLSRRVIHYGGTYCHLPPRTATPAERKKIESTIYTADAIPPSLEFVLSRMVETGLYTQAQKPEYCIVNSYTGNNGISAHVENFRFDEPVTGLTLENGDWIRFHELFEADDGSVRSGKASLAKRTGKKVDVWLPRRSLMVMRGAARSCWQHEIVRSKKDRTGKEWRRVSLTFRTLKVKKRD